MNILSNQGSKRRKEVTIDNINVDVLPVKERARYLNQTTTFEQQETTGIKSRTWASFTRYRQELKSKSYLLRYRILFFNMVITLTLTYVSGTWTLSNEHEKSENVEKSNEEKKQETMRSQQTMKKQKKNNMASKALKERQKKVTAETQIATRTTKSHSWETPMKTSTRRKKKIGSNTWKEARDQMRATNIPCWIVTHEKDEMEIGNEDRFSPRDNMSKKVAKWNPGLSIGCQASSAVGRP